MQTVALLGKSLISVTAAGAIALLSAQPAMAGDFASFTSAPPGPESARSGVTSNVRFSVPIGAPRSKSKPSLGFNVAPVRAADFARPVASPTGLEAGFSLNSTPYVRVAGEDVTSQAGEKLGFAAMQDGSGYNIWWIVGGVALVAALVILADDDDGGGY